MSSATAAKPPVRKSRRRWRIAGAFLLFLVTVPVGYFYLNAWLNERELQAVYAELDAEDPNWRWPDLVANLAAPPPDERNSAVQVHKVRALLKAAPFAPLAKKKGPDPRNARFSDEDVKALRAALDKPGLKVREEARKLKDLPEGRFHIEPVENPLDPANGGVIDLEIVGVIRLLQHDAILRGQEGEIEEAAESCQALLHTCHAFNDAPGLLPPLIRDAGRALALDAIGRTLGQGTISPKRLQALQDALALEAEFNALYHALRGERAMSHQLAVLVSEGKTTYSEMYGGMGFKRPVPDRVFDMFPSLFLGDSAEHLRLNNERVKASKLQDEAQMLAFRSVEQKGLKSRGNVSQAVASIIGGMAEQDRITKARLRCAVTAIAAERFRLEHGHWPRDADELLKADLLKEVYRDPFNGQALRWKGTPTGVIIYSVGPDQTDNGGKLSSDPRTPGTDAGFELWAPNYRAVPPPGATK